MAVRELRHQVRGRRRHHYEIGRARQLDVSHLGFVGQAEEVLENFLACK